VAERYPRSLRLRTWRTRHPDHYDTSTHETAKIIENYCSRVRHRCRSHLFPSETPMSKPAFWTRTGRTLTGPPCQLSTGSVLCLVWNRGCGIMRFSSLPLKKVLWKQQAITRTRCSPVSRVSIPDVPLRRCPQNHTSRIQALFRPCLFSSFKTPKKFTIKKKFFYNIKLVIYT
jgi:hypothetical protein